MILTNFCPAAYLASSHGMMISESKLWASPLGEVYPRSEMTFTFAFVLLLTDREFDGVQQDILISF